MNILKSLIDFGKGFTKLSVIGRYAILGVAVFFLAYSCGKKESDDELQSFIVEFNEFKKSAQNTIKYADSAKQVINTLEKDVTKKDETIKQLKIEISFTKTKDAKLSSEIKDLKTKLKNAEETADTTLILVTQDSIISAQDDQIKVKDQIIVKQDSTIKIRDQQMTQMQSALRLSNQRGDSLQTILNNVPKTPKNPNKIFGFIPKPSRTVVAVVSLATGLYIGSEIADK